MNTIHTAKRLLAVLKGESRAILAIVIYAVVIGLLSLIIPVAVSSLISNVAFGVLLIPIVVLSSVVFGFLILTNVSRLLQMYIAELLQRRIMVRLSIELGLVLPKAPIGMVKSKLGKDFINYFLEIPSLQKNLSHFILDGFGLLFQLIAGLSLLFFYNHYLLLLSLVLIILVVFSVMILGFNGVYTSIKTSDAKYELLGFLEECVEKQGFEENVLLKNIDNLTEQYLIQRQKHFTILFRQFSVALLLQALCSAVFLALGGFLVIKNELTLGQLAASEIVLTIILGSISKIGKYLELFYNLSASVYKLDKLIGLPTQNEEIEDFNNIKGPLKLPEYFALSKLSKIVNLNLNSLKKVSYGRSIIYFSSGLIGLILLFVVLIGFLPWVQTVKGSGKVVAFSPQERYQNIAAPIDGRVVQWFVTEGTKIKKGDPIVKIEDIDPLALERLKTELSILESRNRATLSALANAKKNLVRQEKLEQNGISSKRTKELAEIDVNKFESDLATINAEITKIEGRIARQESQLIRSPKDGVVSKILVQQGAEVLKSGQSIMSFVPESLQNAVALIVDGNDMPLLEIGREVRLQFEGWPALIFPGWPSSAIGTFSGNVAFIDPTDDMSGNFRVIVIPKEKWPDSTKLRQGVRAIGWVLLDKVTIGWEIWRRFNGFPPQMPTVKNLDTNYPGK